MNYWGKRGPLKERFWANVKRGPHCWEWGGRDVNQYGHGRIRIGPKSAGRIGTHRLSFQLFYGPIPKGLQVLHSCDNPRCVNPKHLYVGTPADNMRDKVERGRIPRGEEAGTAKLTESQVLEIRNNFIPWKCSAMGFARKFGVSRSTIWAVLMDLSWKHLPSRKSIKEAHPGFRARK